MKKRVQIAAVMAAFMFFLAPQAVFGAVCPVACSTVAACPVSAPDTGDTCPAAGDKCCVAAAGSAGSVTFTNPLGFTTVQGATGAILSALQGIIVTLALVFLVLGGVFYVISGGDEKRITTAKGAITAAMIGLAIGVAAPSFLKEIADVLDWGGAVPVEVTAAVSFGSILRNVLNFLLSMVGILAIIMLVIGGLMYFAAAGDEKRADTAKAIVKYAIIGVAVSLAALVIVTQITRFF